MSLLNFSLQHHSVVKQKTQLDCSCIGQSISGVPEPDRREFVRGELLMVSRMLQCSTADED